MSEEEKGEKNNVDQAFAQLHKNQDKEAINNLLKTVAKEDSLTQEEALQDIASLTDFGKRPAKKRLKEIKGKMPGPMDTDLSIEKIIEIVPHTNEEDKRYRFKIEMEGSEHEIELRSTELMGPGVFIKKIFELTREKVEFENWTETLNDWMEKHTIEVKEEEPVSVEHDIAEAILSTMQGMRTTKDWEEFKEMSKDRVFLSDNGNVLVSNRVIMGRANRIDKYASARKIRSLLDPVMCNGSSKKIRRDEGFFRAWRFDRERLNQEGIKFEMRDEETEETEGENT